MITEETVEIEPTEILLKNMAKFPDLEQYIEENNGNVPSYFFEEELFTLEEWKTCFEQELYKRLGLKIDLSSPE